MSRLSDDARDVVSAETKLPAVAERGNEFSVAVEKPLGIDRRQVGDPTLVVEPYGVTLRSLLRRRSLVVVRVASGADT
jgi:hypothetical protein